MTTMGQLYQVYSFEFLRNRVNIKDYHEEDLFLYIAYSDENVYGAETSMV
jgi:hypothetical protein